ncbi:conserved phage C-terminal domain-containing protein [Xenorhabdus thailandensis]|uniref:conserved phage C-terminal domain-containing protein n=1 Tax=Xenorhabdus thailandensis TaxID=3136255 RepID=UPI0030F442FD
MDKQNITPVVSEIGKINITGNVIPAVWWQFIKFPSGKPDSTAIILLSEIVYWYRPTEIRDELTGELKGFRKRFHSDKLQRSYQSFSDQFGFTKREVTDALKRLRDHGFITLELRKINTANGIVNNVLFIEPVVDTLINITNPNDLGDYQTKDEPVSSPPVTLKRNRGYVETEEGLRQDVIAPTLKRKTNTEITTEITTETNSLCQVPTEPDHNPVQQVLVYFNQVTGSNYRDGKTTMGYIRARLGDGYTVDDLKLITDYLTTKWRDDGKMRDYLRPKTLFGPENCTEYFDKACKWDKAGRPACVNGRWLKAGETAITIDTVERDATFRQLFSTGWTPTNRIQELAAQLARKAGLGRMSEVPALAAWRGIWKQAAEQVAKEPYSDQ